MWIKDLRRSLCILLCSRSHCHSRILSVALEAPDKVYSTWLDPCGFWRDKYKASPLISLFFNINEFILMYPSLLATSAELAQELKQADEMQKYGETYGCWPDVGKGLPRSHLIKPLRANSKSSESPRIGLSEDWGKVMSF